MDITTLSMEDRITNFFKLEGAMLEELEMERKMYNLTPSSHPDYRREWEHFWSKQETGSNRGTDAGCKVNNDKFENWIFYWKNFVDNFEEEKMVEQRRKLMFECGVTAKDIEEHVLKRGKESVVEMKDGLGGISGESLVRVVKVKEGKNVCVMDTLRLLTSLEAVGIYLGKELGLRLVKLQEEALIMECRKFGSSEVMVKSTKCRNLLRQVKSGLEQTNVKDNIETVKEAVKKIGILLDENLGDKQVWSIKNNFKEEMVFGEDMERERRVDGKEVSPCVEMDPVCSPPGHLPLVHKQHPMFTVGDSTQISNLVTPNVHTSTLSNSFNATNKLPELNCLLPQELVLKVKRGIKEALTEDELYLLVKYFRSLEREDQINLFVFVRKLENTDPEKAVRVKKRLGW